MANIETELRAFKNAKKGEDVRDSMISAIRKINTVNEEGVEEIEQKTEQMVEVADSMIQIDEEPTEYTKLKLETTGQDIEVLTEDELNEVIADTDIGTEVVDARTGYDGTVYNSAGDAVRGQFESLQSNLDDFLDENTDNSVSVTVSTSYPLGYRGGLFYPDNNGKSNTSGSYTRTIAPLPIPKTAKYFTVTSKSTYTASVCVFSSPTPSFAQNADNSAIFVRSVNYASSLTVDVRDNEYYFVTTTVASGDRSESTLPSITWASWVGKKIETIEAEVGTLAPITSPVFLGTPSAPDSEIGDATSKIANTKFVDDTLKKELPQTANGFVKLVSYGLAESDAGKAIVNFDANGNGYITLEESSNWKTSKMIACPKNGKLLINGEESVIGIITFYDTENDYTSFVWQERYSPSRVWTEYNCYGNYFTISKNSSAFSLPTIYAKDKGIGFNTVTEYADEEIALYEKVKSEIDSNTLVFSVIADTHYNEYQTRGYKQREIADDFIKISNNIGVDFALHLGDMNDESKYATIPDVRIPANKEHAIAMMEVYSKSNAPFVYVQGHHELFPITNVGDGQTNTTYAFSREKSFGLCGRFTKYLNPHYHGESSSYYIDFPMQKVRLIVLDSTTYNANGFSELVLDFLDQSINTIPNGYKLIVASHCATTQYGDVTVNNGDDVETKLLTYMSNGGTVLAHMHGHYHRDNYNIITNGTQHYPLISQGCGCVEAQSTALSGMENFEATETRNYTSINKYLFDIYCIHVDTGIVKAFRFGAGTDKVINP